MRDVTPSRAAKRHSSDGCCLLLGALTMLCLGPFVRGQSPSQTSTPVIPKIPPAPQVNGSEVDRIIATVNGDLILDSDVDEEVRFDKLKISESPTPSAGESTEKLRDLAIERLIDRDLILQQIQMQPQYSPTDEEVTKDIDDLRKTIPACAEYHCDTPTGWNRYLASEGFTEATFREEWIQRMKVLAFTEQRFKMGIRISNAQIKDYYEKTLLPEYAERHAKPAPLDKVSDRIQALLLERQVTSLLGDWLQSLRAQGNVVVLHPGGNS